TLNTVLHPWLQAELTAILAALPPLAPEATARQTERSAWEAWQAGLTIRFTLPAELPPVRLLLVLDNLAGHKSGALVTWLLSQGVMPLYTPLAGSWLNMAESIQRILVDRALKGQQPEAAAELMDWLAATVRGWNAAPTPFVWGGKRAGRRARARTRRHALGGSGACSRQPIRRSRVPTRSAINGDTHGK
ncbi:MAG: transposase, partial [Dehalococcoidia bacterium]